ncbi:hypothetical protein B0H16DRAFT_960975 [Mycena metata]|uniref:Uncharacterized protein n=1 Tax=Mycena metata TaxID=1033252 RepID=A0AAD7N530_9AGAR|nr:hypothetical protein B0H16DRAFT_960975 [Mycena metata]
MSVSVRQMQVLPPTPAPYTLQRGVAGMIHTPAAGGERKRTTSFSSPPRKRLHRTETYVDLSFTLSSSTATATATASTSTSTASSTVPYTRTLRFYKEQKERRRALLRREPPSLDPHTTTSYTTPAAPHRTSSASTTPRVQSTSTTTPPIRRTSPSPPPPPAPPRARTTPPSPLVDGKVARTPPPVVRAPFPSRSKPSPSPSTLTSTASSKPSPSAAGKKPAADLHRRAITACMRASPAGAKILHMGARLAVGIMSATRELERMCETREAERSWNLEGAGLFSFAEDDGEDGDMEGLEDEELDAEGVDEEDLMDEEEVEVLAAFSPASVGRLIAPAPASTSSSLPLPSTRSASTTATPNARQEDADVPMPDAPSPTTPTTPQMSASWIVIGAGGAEEKTQGQGDWEMVCV